MKQSIQDVVDVLDKILAGGDVDFDEVQRLNWSANGDLDRLLQEIYRELQMFASDEDIRKRDLNYDRSWRRGLGRLRDELEARLSEGH